MGCERLLINETDFREKCVFWLNYIDRDREWHVNAFYYTYTYYDFSLINVSAANTSAC